MVESGKKMVPDTLGGNKRTEISKEDVIQAVQDIINWFKEHAPEYHEKHIAQNAGPEQKAVEPVLSARGQAGNAACVALLSAANGSFQLMDTYLSLKIEEVEKSAFATELCPIAKDIDENYICVSSDGTLVSTDNNGKVEEQLKQTLGQYLEDLRNKLLTNKLVYEDGCGLMEIS